MSSAGSAQERGKCLRVQRTLPAAPVDWHLTISRDTMLQTCTVSYSDIMRPGAEHVHSLLENSVTKNLVNRKTLFIIDRKTEN